MPLFALGLAGALGGAGGLYKYQRENFMFDAEQRIKREYQAQDMRIKQFELYREDIRDLVELTVSKMDNYLIVNCLQLGFCIIMLTEGQPHRCYSPRWLLWLYSLCTVGSFFYFLLSIWLSIHASIAAHSFGVRLLTQLVRLPTPNTQQLDAARAKALDYEGLSFTELFRIPLWKQQLKRLTDNMDAGPQAADDAASDDGSSQAGAPGGDTFNPVTMLEHVKKYRELQAHWQCYDAYARVSMTLGTQQLLLAMCYFVIVAIEVEIQCPWAALGAVVVMASAACLLMRLDVHLSAEQLHGIRAIIVIPPILTFACLMKEDSEVTIALLTPFVFLLHIAWVAVMLWIGWANESQAKDEPALPTRFRTVLYLDVFSWVDAARQQRQEQAQRPADGSGEAVDEDVSLGEDASGEMVMRELPPDSRRVSVSFERRASFAPGLGVVPEAPAKPLPKSLHASLVELCWQWRIQLNLDLQNWESDKVISLIEDDQFSQQMIKTLRARFEYLVRQLRDAEPEGEQLAEGVPDTDDDPVWLKLEWNPSGHAMIYFYNVADESTLWTVPEKGRIFDIEMMVKQVDAFEEKVASVVNYTLVGAPSSAPADADPGEVSASASSSAGGGLDMAAATAESESVPASVPEEAVATEAGNQEGTAGGEAAATNTPYGGHEAVNLGGQEVAAQFGGGGHTFHPHQGTLNPTARRRPPGLMPWRTFFQASLILFVIWSIGFLWILASEIFGDHFSSSAFNRDPNCNPDDLMASGANHVSSGLPERIHILGGWPHPFFQPEGLACNARGDELTLLVMERYAVHELLLSSNAEGTLQGRLQPALESCVAHNPAFHAGGFHSLSLDCASGAYRRNADCDGILFGATLQRNGTRGLMRCKLDRYASEAEHAHIHGRDWHAFTTGIGGDMWALRDRTVVRLGARRGATNEFVPIAEVPHMRAANTTHLQVLPDHTVLGLQPTRTRISAWQVMQDGSIGAYAWQLPRIAKWHAFCATRDAVFLAGTSSSDGTIGVWRADLPGELHIRPVDP